ncbi:MAG: hypothetical protein ABEH64_11620 [Salinirussus sp.]
MPDPVPGVEEDVEIDGGFADRLSDLDGKSLTFVSLGTPNSKEMHESLQRILTDEYGVESIEYYEKDHFSRPLTDEDVETIVGDAVDGVIEGFALCGSCNSSSSVDAIAFETHGIPTVQIISEDFRDLNNKIAGSYGYDRLPWVAIPQSTKYDSAEEIDDLMEEIATDLHARLTCEDCLSDDCATHGARQLQTADD